MAGSILCINPANERWHYSVTLSLIGWVHKLNDLCYVVAIVKILEKIYSVISPSHCIRVAWEKKSIFVLLNLF